MVRDLVEHESEFLHRIDSATSAMLNLQASGWYATACGSRKGK